MNIPYRTILLLLGSMLAAHGEQDMRSRFERMHPLEGAFSAGQAGRMTVTADMFGQCRDYPADVRIIGADGMQWPFFVHVFPETVDTGTLIPEILNESFVEGGEPYLQFDLAIPRDGGSMPVHNRLELWTSGHDFVRQVEVYSGTPRGRLATGYLIDFSTQRNARNRIIRYPESDAGRLHVRVYTNARDAGETFRLSAARLHYRTSTPPEREIISAEALAASGREYGEGVQTFLFDLGRAGRPVEAAVLQAEDPSYARSVSVSGRSSDREPWQWAGDGEIHKLKADTNGVIRLYSEHRFLRIRIFNHDDRPLSVSSIELQARPRHLVFEAAAAGPAAVYFRAWDLKPPRYDLRGRMPSESILELPQVRVLEMIPNEKARKQPWRKYSRGLAILAVGAVSLLVMGIITSMLRQQRAGEDG
jgi:hypothetical protein